MNRLSTYRVCASLVVLSVCAGAQAAVLSPLSLTAFHDRTKVRATDGLFVNYAVTSGGGGTVGTGLLTVEGGSFAGGFVAGPIDVTVDLDNDATALDGNAIDNDIFASMGTFSVTLAVNWDTVAGTVDVDTGNAANALAVTADLDGATDAPGDLGSELLFSVDVGSGVGAFDRFGGGTDELELTFLNGVDLTAFGLPDMILGRIGGLILNVGDVYDPGDQIVKASDDAWDSDLFAADFSNATTSERFGVATPQGSAIVFIPTPTALSAFAVFALVTLTRRRPI